MREGYEGLVRGNVEERKSSVDLRNLNLREDVNVEDSFVQNLRFGDGDLLRDGTGDYTGGRTLKGRYIVRVGWDDVRGWFSEVRVRVASTVSLRALSLFFLVFLKFLISLCM